MEDICQDAVTAGLAARLFSRGILAEALEEEALEAEAEDLADSVEEDLVAVEPAADGNTK